MDQQTGVSLTEDGIWALYSQQADGLPPLVPYGVLPTQSRKGAGASENAARRRTHDLLDPRYRASVAEVEVLGRAGIPLLSRPEGGFHIDPTVPRESAGVERATSIAMLYGLAPGSSALVPLGMLPTRFRKGADASENAARQRMHDLLDPEHGLASDGEVEVLGRAGIPLLPRPKGGFHIDPRVRRVSEEAASSARVESATSIAMLYGLAPGSSAFVPYGMLPTQSRKGADASENAARHRTHDLLKSKYRASAAEVEVLGRAGIPLLPRPKGGFNIDPKVPRVSEEAASLAGVERATSMAMLYGLAPGSSALVPYGMLPTQSRKGADASENAARQRTHDLLQLEHLASAAEVEVLGRAGIPLLPRPNGGLHIDPKVPRVSEEAAWLARVERATSIARLYGLAPGSSALVPYGMLPTVSRKGADASENAARQRMHRLLDATNLVSAAEGAVLRGAGIPLLPRPQGGLHIDPKVPRESSWRRGDTVPVLQSGQSAAADALASAPPTTTADTSAPPPPTGTGADVSAVTDTLSGWGPDWDTPTLMWQNTQAVTWPDLAAANPPMPSQDDRPTPILVGAGQYLPPTWTASRQSATIPPSTTQSSSPPPRPTKQPRR
ncbi:hypothetical protein [Streptomyces sp. NPDC048277]|uniref:hypothetical protein n=1 Tax=Streptomyces sp. NPDC048277 TaxID=3155027 RepID=UPI00340F8843